MNYLDINNFKNTITENLKIICQELIDFGFDTLDNLDLDTLKKLNDDINIEYNNFYGLN